LIHFDFEERYQDELIVGSAITRREGIAYAVVVHVLILTAFIVGPRLGLFQPSAEELEARRQEQQRQLEEERNRTFVFVQPKLDMPAKQPPPRAELSDIDRKAQAPQKAPQPQNPLPFSRGNSTQRTEADEGERARVPETPPQPAQPPPPQPQPPQPEPPQQQIARNLPTTPTGLPRPPESARPSTGGLLRDAVRNLEKYMQSETFNNPQGGSEDPGSAIQFDTKGVEFGPWIRRFVAQVRRNWFVPQAAMTFRGSVVLQFNIHKTGVITDLQIVRPSEIESFTRAAVNAIQSSSPTEPLPPEYPDEKALFTVTFYYNEPAN
jgi:TonB family protein